MSTEPEESGQEPSDDELAAAKEHQVDLLFLEVIADNRWKEPVTCPVCKSGEWETGVVVDLPIRYRDHRRAYSLVPVSCTTCGYTMLFNGSYLGLFDEEGNPKEPEQLKLSDTPEDIS